MNGVRYPLPKKTVDAIEIERNNYIKKCGMKINKTKFVEIRIHQRLMDILKTGEPNVRKIKRR